MKKAAKAIDKVRRDQEEPKFCAAQKKLLAEETRLLEEERDLVGAARDLCVNGGPAGRKGKLEVGGVKPGRLEKAVTAASQFFFKHKKPPIF